MRIILDILCSYLKAKLIVAYLCLRNLLIINNKVDVPVNGMYLREALFKKFVLIKNIIHFFPIATVFRIHFFIMKNVKILRSKF